MPQQNAGVAQLAEQLICNQQVAGSSPIAGSDPFASSGTASGAEAIRIGVASQRFGSLESDFINPEDLAENGLCWNFQGRLPEWLKGTDCKSVGDAYVGSNPTPPIGSVRLF